MHKKTFAALAAALLASAVVAPALARFDLHFASDLGDGGTAYEWYAPDMRMTFDAETRDGVLPDGRPYSAFQGTSRSQYGHCLEVTVTPGLVTPPYGQVFVEDHGNLELVMNPNFETGGYPTMRLWLRRTPFGSLPWTVYVAPNDGNTEYTGDLRLSVRRLEVSEADCTTNQPLPWASVVGNSVSYTVETGNF